MRCTSRYVWNCMDLANGMKHFDINRHVGVSARADLVEVYPYFKYGCGVKTAFFKVNGDRTIVDSVNQGVRGKQDH